MWKEGQPDKDEKTRQFPFQTKPSQQFEPTTLAHGTMLERKIIQCNSK